MYSNVWYPWLYLNTFIFWMLIILSRISCIAYVVHHSVFQHNSRVVALVKPKMNPFHSKKAKLLCMMHYNFSPRSSIQQPQLQNLANPWTFHDSLVAYRIEFFACLCTGTNHFQHMRKVQSCLNPWRSACCHGCEQVPNHQGTGASILLYDALYFWIKVLYRQYTNKDVQKHKQQ